MIGTALDGASAGRSPEILDTKDGGARSVVRTGITALALALALFALSSVVAARAGATSFSASPLPGSTFTAADGDETAAGGNTDWQTYAAAPGVVTTDTPVGTPNPNGPDFFYAGHEDTPDTWTVSSTAGGITPAKSNALAAFGVKDPLTTDTFFYFGFKRESTSNANAFLGFELNKRTTTWVNSVGTTIPCRSTGDILISYEIDPSNKNVIFTAYKWTGTSGPPECPEGRTGSYSVIALPPGTVQGYMNFDGAVTNYLDTADLGTSFSTGTFGEGAVNVSQALAGAGDPCFNFGQVQLHTRSSASLSSAFQDTVNPAPIVLRTCTASGVKYEDLNGNGTRDAGEPGLAGWRMYVDSNNNGAYDAGEPTDVTAADGSYSIGGISGGNRTIREAPPAGDTQTWYCSQPGPAGTLSSGGADPTQSCHYDRTFTANSNFTGVDFGNYRNPTIEVVKNLVPAADPGRFDLKIDGTTKKANAGNGDTTGAQVVSFANHTVSETGGSTPATSLSDYTSTYSCTVNGTVTATGTGTSVPTGVVKSGDVVKCTFTNTRDAKLTIVKDAVPNDAQDFAFTTTGSGLSSFSLDDDADPTLSNTKTFTVKAPNFGAKTVVEGVTAGWSLTDLTCTTGGTGDVPTRTASVTLGAGDNVTCTYTNKKDATVTIVKDAVPNDAQDFAFTATGTQTSPFSLDDDADPTLSNTKVFTFSGATGFGSKTITEGTTTGWSLTGLTCSAGGTPNIGTRTVTLDVTPGSAITCTYTNTKATTVTVIKHVINADGGTATAGDWSLHLATGGNDVANSPQPGSESGTVYIVQPGTFDVSETGGPGGYAASFSGDCDSNGSLSVTVGQSKTCTITNNDIAPQLTVIKKVVNQNGSTAVPSDFTMHVTGTAAAQAAGAPFDFPGADTPGTTNTLHAGDYAVNETGALTSDYTESDSADCTGSLAVGESKTCTITNTRKTGSLTVVKQLIPSTDAGRFNLQIDGTTEATNVGDGGTTGAVSVNTGDHTVGEIAGNAGDLADYIKSISCDNGASGSGAGPLTVTIGDGDDVTCTVTNVRKATVTIHKVTDPHSSDVTFPFSSGLPQGGGVAADGSFSLADGGSVTSSVVPGTYAVSENDPRSLGYKLVGLVCTESAVQDSTVSTGAAIATSRSASLHANPGETIDCTFTNRKVISNAVVVKAGDTFAYHGDTVSYSFTVTNTGNSPLHDVHVSDDKCPNVSATPTSVQNDNGDAFLDPVGKDGVGPEVWVFTCSYVIGTHQAGEANPIVNTATVTGTDEYDRPVADTDTHSTQILHQALALAKTGPATATQGDRVGYTLKLTNTGDTSFAATSLNLTDPLCDAPPLRTSTGSDTSPSSLDPGDVWTYTCSVPSATGQTSIHNVADVVGKDIHNRTATAEATADTVLAPLPVVLPISATSPPKLRGTTGCIPTAAKITVTALKVKSVTFTVDGKKVKKLLKANQSGNRYVLTIPVKSVAYGTHTVKATVVYTSAGKTVTRKLQMIITRCKPPKPQFTG